MILKQGVDLVDLPETIGGPCELTIYSDDPEKNPLAVGYTVYRVPAGQVMMHTKEEAAVRGMPSMFAILAWGPQLQLYPAPDKDYYARFSYTPTVKVI